MTKIFKSRQGFSLIEILIASVIFFIAGLAVLSIIRNISLGVVAGRQKIKADNFAKHLLEYVKAKSVDSFETVDTAINPLFGTSNIVYSESRPFPQIAFLGGTTDYFPGMTADLSVGSIVNGRRDVNLAIFAKTINGNIVESKYYYQVTRIAFKPQGGGIEGFVYDNLTLNPINQATVYAPMFNNPINNVTVKTDPAGRYLLVNTAEGDVPVTAYKINFAAAAYRPDAAAPTQGYYDGQAAGAYTVTITVPGVLVMTTIPASPATKINLFPLHSAFLQVNDRSGTGITGAQVRCQSPWSFTLVNSYFYKNTDATGRVEFANLLSGTREFYITNNPTGAPIQQSDTAIASPNYAYLPPTPATINHVFVGGNGFLNNLGAVSLNRYGYLNLTVTGLANNSGVFVKISGGSEGAVGPYGPTSALGKYYVYNRFTTNGDRTFKVSKFDGTNYGYWGEATQNCQPEINGGDHENQVTVNLSSGAVLNGNLIDQDSGFPFVQPITVSATMIDGTAFPPVLVDAAGNFTLTYLKPGNNTIKFTLIDSATIQVTVEKDSDGTLIEGATIYYLGTNKGMTDGSGHLDVNITGFDYSKTENLNPGDNTIPFQFPDSQFKKNVTLTAKKPTYADKNGTYNNLKPGQNVTLIPNIKMLVNTCRIRGKISSASTGQGIAGIRVRDNNNLGTFTDSDLNGDYDLDGVKIIGSTSNLITDDDSNYYPNTLSIWGVSAGNVYNNRNISLTPKSGL